MELRTLRYFVEIADAGTVSAAAASVHVTQPALSRQVRQLERELGVDLFNRVGRRLSLSPAGQQLLPLARGLLHQADRLAITASSLGTGQLPRLKLAAPATTLTDIIAPFIAKLSSADPTPFVVSTDILDLRAALLRGADLVIDNGEPGPPLRGMPLAVFPVLAYVPDDHPLGGRAVVSLPELATAEILCPPHSYAARRALQCAFADAGLTPNTLIECSSGTVAQALAAARRGVAIVSDDPRFDLIPTRIALADGHLSIPLVAVWDPAHPAAGTLTAIAKRLSNYINDRYGAAHNSADIPGVSAAQRSD